MEFLSDVDCVCCTSQRRRTLILLGMSDALADLAAGAARCAGSRVGDEMVLPRVVLCTRFLTMEFLLSGRTMVLPGMSDALADLAAAAARCAGSRVRGEMALPRVVLCTRFLTMEFLSNVDCVCVLHFAASAGCFPGRGVYTLRRLFLGTPRWFLSRHSAQSQCAKTSTW